MQDVIFSLKYKFLLYWAIVHVNIILLLFIIIAYFYLLLFGKVILIVLVF